VDDAAAAAFELYGGSHHRPYTEQIAKVAHSPNRAHAVQKGQRL
jgi:hypothetical protein